MFDKVYNAFQLKKKINTMVPVTLKDVNSISKVRVGCVRLVTIIYLNCQTFYSPV